MWHMTDDETVWLTSCLVYHDKISEVVALADLDEVFKDVAATIDTRRIRKDQLELLLEGNETLARVAASRH